ncbi:hypothetical protein Tco_1233063, partial [Tanacetum coccineum]
MDPNFTNENDPWEYSLDIDGSDLNITHVLRSSSSARVEPSPYTPTLVRIIPGPVGTIQVSSSTCFEPSSSTPNPVRIIPDPAGLVQPAKQLKENIFILDPDGALIATNYVNAFGGTVTGCLGDIDNFLKKGDLNVTLKDLSGIVPGTIHCKVLD